MIIISAIVQVNIRQIRKLGRNLVISCLSNDAQRIITETKQQCMLDRDEQASSLALAVNAADGWSFSANQAIKKHDEH